MNDPWDDLYYGTGGLIITPSGMRIPVGDASFAPPAASSLPARAPAGGARAVAPASAGAGFKGVGPKGYRRSDQRIREAICERMLLDPYLDASNVAVGVTRGRVTLGGSVPWDRRREGAIAAAERVVAHAVQDELRVESGAGSGAGARKTGGRRKPKAKRRATARRQRGGRR